MTGAFNGLSDDQWETLHRLLPKDPDKRRPGAPHSDLRLVMNSILYILKTGTKWCYLPSDRAIFAPKSTAHRWLKRWEEDGTLENIKRKMLVLADLNREIDWSRASIDGSFSPWEGRRRGNRGRT